LSGAEITVAVATCGRPASLARCLEALARGTTLPRETIVVDQAPSPDSRRVVEQCRIARVRYLEQSRLGVSASRNLALAAASGVVLAVIDDDCAPDPGWLTALAAAFDRAPKPAAVTGPILPLGVQPPGTYAISLRTDARAVDYRGQVLPWIAGSGGNFAARRDVLRRHVGWDERLGPGSPGKAAEDADLLYRILRDGGIVRYEPAARVRHEWQTWARRLATRSSYAQGVGALCGLWLRRGDGFALRMLAAYAKDHRKALASAARRGDRRAITEHLRALAGLLPGLNYGLRLGQGVERSAPAVAPLPLRGEMDPAPTDALGSPSRASELSSFSQLPAPVWGGMKERSTSVESVMHGAPASTGSGARSVMWRSLATLLVAAASVVAVVIDWHSPVRTVLALAFLLFAPGVALTEMLAIRDPIQRLALIAGTSLAVDSVVALALVYAGAFSVNLSMILLAGLTFAALAVANIRAFRLLVKSRAGLCHT
jgi:GT2 family glycosyltransferase